MAETEHKNNSYSRFLLISLPPLILYILILALEIPYSFSEFFQSYSIPLFSLTLIVYYLSFQLTGKSSWIAGLSITLLLFGLTLSYQWTSGFSDNRILAGLLPYKDGNDYYNGARQLLNGQMFTGRSAGRPLFPGFLATILLITRQNLQITLAMQAAFASIACYLAARHLRNTFGPLSAAIFMAFLYAYSLPFIGLAWTELLGLTFGCLSFILLLRAARSLRLRDLGIGLAVLMIAVSTRAGAFLVFPMIAVWAGMYITKTQRFSIPVAVASVSVALIAYWVSNSLYPLVTVALGNSTFGRFAFAIYGQVSGGTGWHRAIEDLGTRNPSIVMDAALQIFIEHPMSILIASAKSYRDFFIPGRIGILPLYPDSGIRSLDRLVWIAAFGLLFRGLFISIKKRRDPLFALLIATFVGIILSIPFLPPIDGGRRFYASTMPFFFALPAVAFSGVLSGRWISSDSQNWRLERTAQALSIFLAAITLVMPVLILNLSPNRNIAALDCPTGEVPFAVRVDSGTYIDLVPAESSSCGLAPNICLNDFKANGAEKNIDPFYQSVVLAAESRDSATRFFTANDLVGGKYYFFVGPASFLEASEFGGIVSGCAVKTKSPSTLTIDP